MILLISFSLSHSPPDCHHQKPPRSRRRTPSLSKSHHPQDLTPLFRSPPDPLRSEHATVDLTSNDPDPPQSPPPRLLRLQPNRPAPDPLSSLLTTSPEATPSVPSLNPTPSTSTISFVIGPVNIGTTRTFVHLSTDSPTVSPPPAAGSLRRLLRQSFASSHDADQEPGQRPLVLDCLSRAVVSSTSASNRRHSSSLSHCHSPTACRSRPTGHLDPTGICTRIATLVDAEALGAVAVKAETEALRRSKTVVDQSQSRHGVLDLFQPLWRCGINIGGTWQTIC